ncbi:hypothetical protein NE237_013112 [Protea cynaroides]|uniref:BAG domain-containing protein n=1 Tax=Protea cynaroides TaxID=273540 RepID=A0A9Q0JXI3_9MAGN|nr:hypothetical protein NE237_013112 [Protea cynaroides]
MSHFYRPMYSYSIPPHQKNHTLCSDHYYPNWEMASPQINGDIGRPPIMYEPPSYSGGHVYLNPAECHGCCTHSYFPTSYGFRPPHSHPQPPPFPHCHYGPYPPYPEAYTPYFVPPPHYSFGQPRYDYDKIFPSNHCCGCPNHKCSSKTGSNVMIEEQEPEVEKAEGKFSEPVKSGDYQKPIVWIPPGYMKEKDRNWLSEPGPQVWSGGLPCDMSNIQSLKQGGEEGMKQDKKNEETRTHFPYPIIWMPAYEKPQEPQEAKAETKDLKEVSSGPKSPEGTPSKQYQQNEDKRCHFPFPFFYMPANDMKPETVMKDPKEVGHGSKSAKEVTSKLKTIPVTLLQNGDHGTKPGVDDTTGIHAKAAEEELKPKSIPAKATEDVGETGTELKSIPVKQMKDYNANKASHGSTKIQPASQKASKLPPVCLRVDPLPKKKNGNGTSRSHSHMGKESLDSKVHDPNLKKASEEKASKNDTEEKMRDNRKTEDTRKSERDVPVVVKEAVPFGIPVIKEAKIDGKEQKTNMEEVDSKTEKKEDARRKKKDMSATEAAVLIQAAYRGYEVRKREPLKKLRQLAKVREQVEVVRERIRALESSPESWMDEKQRVTIGETIMGLLLQLDVIQGLHSSLRDIRKSVARELVSLQERLDSMSSQKSEVPKSRTDASTNSAGQVVENLCQTDVDVGGVKEEETSLELSTAPEHGIGSELNEPSDESVEYREPALDKEHADAEAEGNGVVPVPLTNEVLADSEPLVVEKEVEDNSEREHAEGNEVVHVPLTDEVLADSSEQCEEKVLGPLVVEKEVEDNSEREPTNTVVEPWLVRELTESPEMLSEEAHFKAAEMKPSMELKDEEKDPGTDPETVVKSELESKPLGPDELPLVMGGRIESVADQLKEAMDQSSTLQELPLGVTEEAESCGSNQNVDQHDTMKSEQLGTESSDSDVGHETTGEEKPLVEGTESADYDSEPGYSVMQPSGEEELRDEEHEAAKEEKPLVESAESADYDSEPGYSVMQPSGKEELRDEELLTNPKLEDSTQILQVVDERSNEMVADVGSSQAVSLLPSDSTDHMVAPSTEETEKHIPSEKPMPNTELPKIDDESIVVEAGGESLPFVQLEAVKEALEVPDLTDQLPNETGNKSCDSEMVGEVTSSAPPMEGEITSSDPVAQVSHNQVVGQVSLPTKDLVEDNEKLKEMLEKLVQAGKEQLSVISNLNGRIKDLEKKLKKKKQMRMRPKRVAALSSAKRSTGVSKGNSVICAA